MQPHRPTPVLRCRVCGFQSSCPSLLYFVDDGGRRLLLESVSSTVKRHLRDVPPQFAVSVGGPSALHQALSSSRSWGALRANQRAAFEAARTGRVTEHVCQPCRSLILRGPGDPAPCPCCGTTTVPLAALDGQACPFCDAPGLAWDPPRGRLVSYAPAPHRRPQNG